MEQEVPGPLTRAMQPILKRPGMYVGPNPVHLLWYLEGMFAIASMDLEPSMLRATTLWLELCDRLNISDDEMKIDLLAELETRLRQGDPYEQMRFISQVAGDLLARFEGRK